jgi:transcriptional regulator with XRE-family HTH domain
MDNLGDTIRKYREAKELPLHAVADYLGIGLAILHEIECGDCIPTREFVVKLAGYYGVNEEDLLVSWLSDKLVNDLKGQDLALRALQVAAEKIVSEAYQKADKKQL